MASNHPKKMNKTDTANSDAGNAKSPVTSNRSSDDNNTQTKLLTESEANALRKLHESLFRVPLGNLDDLKKVISEHFWPKKQENAIPLLDGISKLNPKFQQKIEENHYNQAHQQIRLRWTQSDLIYCLAFKIPNFQGYYLAKVGMTATAGEYDEKEKKTSSRFEKLHEVFNNEILQSKLGRMNLAENQPTFKYIVSPYDTSNLQDVEKRTRKNLGWPVQKSIMTHYSISVPTEWIIIPRKQSEHLYEKVRGIRRSKVVELLDTRVLDDLPELNDADKVDEFKWRNEETKEDVIFTPFKEQNSENSIHGTGASTSDVSNINETRCATNASNIHSSPLTESKQPRRNKQPQTTKENLTIPNEKTNKLSNKNNKKK